jgi:hypothetical protein
LTQYSTVTVPVTFAGYACTVQGCPDEGEPRTFSVTDGAEVEVDVVDEVLSGGFDVVGGVDEVLTG